MNQLKWILLALGMTAFASVGLVACGDDEQTGCDTVADCSDGQVCVNSTCADICFDADDCTGNQGCSGACAELNQPICFTECSENDDCGENEVCNIKFCDGAFGRCEVASAGQCTDNDDCSDGEVCNVVTAECQPKCTGNADCDGGLVCNTDSGMCIFAGTTGCSSDTDCGEGESCKQNACVPANPDDCTDTEECYDRGNSYCGNVGGENQCVDTSCGASFNSCTRCTLGAGGGSKAPNAPLIFSASQVKVGAGSSNCEADSAQCGGETAKLFCKFAFHSFDPNGDFAAKNANVFVVSGNGNASSTFGVKQNGDIVEFGGCFPNGVNSPGTAVFVRDNAGNASNTLCVSGTR